MAYTLELFDDDRKLLSTLFFSDSSDAIKAAATHTLRSGGLSILRDGEQIIFVLRERMARMSPGTKRGASTTIVKRLDVRGD